MSTLLLELANIALVTIEFFMLMVLAGGFFATTLSRAQYFIRCVISFVVNYVALLLFGGQMYLRLALLAVLLAIELKAVYKTHIAKTLLISALYLSVVCIVDSAVLYLLSSVFGIGMNELLQSPYSYYLLAYFAKVLELFMAAFIRVWAKGRFHDRPVGLAGSVRFCIFPVTILIMSAILLNAFLNYPDAAPQLLFCVFILLVLDGVAIVLLDQFEEQQQKLMEHHVLQRELKSAQDNVAVLSVSYHHERKLTHDFQNQLMAVLGLLEKDGGGQAAQAYIREVLQSEHAYPAKKVATNRAIFDIIVNQKYILATQNNIAMVMQLEDMSDFPLPDNALVVVLANLLDNAIEACAQIEDISQREITIKAKVEASESFLFIENSVSKPVEIQGGRIRTTKKDARSHGYGLQNVQAIIQRYNGAYAMHYSDFKFSFVVHFLHDEVQKVQRTE